MHPIHHAKIKCRASGEKQYVFQKRIPIYSCRLENGELKEEDRRQKRTAKEKLLIPNFQD